MPGSLESDAGGGAINTTDHALPVRFTRDCLIAPEKYLRHVLDEH